MIVGPATRDVNIDYTGVEDRCVGGAVTFCTPAARAAGAAVFAAVKASPDDRDVLDALGGDPAGGVKTVTMGVLLLSVIATARGRSRVTVFRRTISAQQISDAVSVVSMVFMAAFVSGIFLSVSNGLDFMDCLYETISAIATVGLSTGITPVLNLASQLVIIVLMFFGRVGVMTISLGFLVSSQVEERYRYADTKVLIG